MKSTSWILLFCLLGLLTYADETQKQQVETLIKKLQDQEWSIRANTAQALGQMGVDAKEAKPQLILLLKKTKNTNPDVHTIAVKALGRIEEGSINTGSALVKLLQHTDPDVRDSAIQALGNIGTEDAVPELIKLLKGANQQDTEPGVDLLQLFQNQHPRIRTVVAKALGNIGAEDAVPELTKLLQDNDEQVRASAAQALGQIGEKAKEATPQLILLLQDDNEQVRGVAVGALRQIGTPQALKAVKNLQ